MNKEVFFVVESKVQTPGTNVFVTLPSAVRSILKPKKGDEVQFIIYSDKTIEIKIKED